MSSIKPPSINFEDLRTKITDGRFTSKKISEFAQKRTNELFEIHETTIRYYQDFQGKNDLNKNLILAGIEEISKKCTEDYPVSAKVRQLKELKALLTTIKHQYCEFRDRLTEEEKVIEEAEKLFISDCGMKKSQLMRNEQEEYEKSHLFQAFLEKIKQKFNESLRETIYFAYVKPTDSRYEKESWVQTFLKYLQAHLKNAGFSNVQLDIVSNRYGANENEFMEGARTSGYVLLFGTESLLDEYSKGISAVCTQLNQIMHKRENEGKDNVYRVFPILLSGEHRSAFPPEYERFSTIRDWRDNSYLHNFQQLFLELLGLPPEDYQPISEKVWQQTLSKIPEESPPPSVWYQQQREAIDTCRRKKDAGRLRAIEVSHNPLPVADESPPQPTFANRLKEHYINRSTISILTFREKGKWELTLPVDALYTKLAMITEQERDERKDPSTFVDKRLPTHETIFKPKREVEPEAIFQEAENKRAVIYGSAGIGKTTFVTMLLYRWAKGNLFEEFQTVLCIRLRNLTTNFYPNAPGYTYHALDLLKKEHESLGVDSLDHDPRTTLLVLDGWDELPPETRPSGHLSTAFQELQERYPNLLITSRPGAIEVDDTTEFEILGFSNSQISDYTDRFFQGNEFKALGIKRFIRQNPLAKSLAHIPINLSILCALYNEDDTLFDAKSPLTISAVYDRIINQFYKIFLLRKGTSQNEVRNCTLLSLHRDIEPIASCLKEIAYSAALKEGIYTDEREISRIVYQKKLETEDIRRLGLFRIENSQGSFIHLTFQEYFAAIYLSGLYESSKTRSQALEIVRQIKFNLKHVRILSMVAGVLSLTENQQALQAYFDDLHKEPRDVAELYELTLLARCFEECDHPHELFQYAEFLKRIKIFIEIAPWITVIEPLFRGNRKLIAEPSIAALFIELLNQNKYRLDLLRTLNEISSYSGFLPQEIIQKLEDLLKRGNLQLYIFPLLKNVGGEQAKKILFSLLADPQIYEIHSSVVKTLGEIASTGEKIGEKGIQRLLSLLTNPEVQAPLRSSAAGALEKISSGGEEIGDGIKVLISLIKDSKEDQAVRFSAATALGEIASKRERVGEVGIVTFISLLQDSTVNLSLRSSAVKAIEKIIVRNGDVESRDNKIGKKGIEALLYLLANPHINQVVRDSALTILTKIASGGEQVRENGIEALISLLANPKIKLGVRISTAKKLENIASENKKVGKKGIEALLSLFADTEVHKDLRYSAATALEKIASGNEKIGEEILEIFITYITDSKVDLFTCDSAARILGHIASSGKKIGQEGIKALVSLLTDPWTNQYKYVCDSVVAALANLVFSSEKIGEEEIEALISCITDPKMNQGLRNSAATALEKISSGGEKIGEKGIETLISLLANPGIDLHMCALTAQVIGHIASGGEKIGEKGIETLISLLANPRIDLHMCTLTVRVIKHIASGGEKIGEKGIETLISLLANPGIDLHMCTLTVRVIKHIASGGEKIGEKGIETLISFLANPQLYKYVLHSVAEALEAIASNGERVGEKAVEVLISLLTNTKVENDVRTPIAEALGKIVSNDERIVEKGLKALKSLVADPNTDQDVRYSAIWAIEKIALESKKIGENERENLLFFRLKALISLIADPKVIKSVRDSAVMVIGKIIFNGEKIGEKNITTLISLIADPKVIKSVRGSAVMAIGKIIFNGEKIGEKNITTLISLIADPNKNVRDSAVMVIGRITSGGENIGERGIEVITSLLADTEVKLEIRHETAKTLKKIVFRGERIKEEEVLKLLSILANLKEEKGVRTSAGEVLEKMPSSVLVSHLSEEMLKLYCVVTHRALIRENGSWTISSKIE